MKKELLKEIRSGWVVCSCLLFLVITVIGCGGGSSSSSDTDMTWKEKFPTLWSTAYAQDVTEPNPEDVTYEEFLAAVISALQSDQAFLAQIQGERGPAGPQGSTGPEGPEGPQGGPGTCSCPIIQGELDALLARIAELETKLASVSVGDDING
ncbi:MAG: hypothetical protein ACP5G0_08475, partial [Desulfomonilia bacterium]